MRHEKRIDRMIAQILAGLVDPEHATQRVDCPCLDWLGLGADVAQVTPCELGGPADVGDVTCGRSTFTRCVVGVHPAEQGRLAAGPERRRPCSPGCSRSLLLVRIRNDRWSFEGLKDVGTRRIELGETIEIVLRTFQCSFQALPFVSWSTIRQCLEFLSGHFDPLLQTEGRESYETGSELRIVAERLQGRRRPFRWLNRDTKMLSSRKSPNAAGST